MRRQKCSWFLALLVVAGALVLTSCMNQEGIGPGEGELKGKSDTGGVTFQ
jgi:predicted small secreted protein